MVGGMNDYLLIIKTIVNILTTILIMLKSYMMDYLMSMVHLSHQICLDMILISRVMRGHIMQTTLEEDEGFIIEVVVDKCKNHNAKTMVTYNGDFRIKMVNKDITNIHHIGKTLCMHPKSP
ncbi:hypothetical protein CR513_25848, partial [Mucuna pruriens]